MAVIIDIFHCPLCGHVIEVVGNGVGTLVCCDKPMQQLDPNTTDAALEKHVPVVNNDDGQITVQVGSVAHPMTDEHYIMWIEAIVDGVTHRADLKPGDAPTAVFCGGQQVFVRAYCNLHGLWKA